MFAKSLAGIDVQRLARVAPLTTFEANKAEVVVNLTVEEPKGSFALERGLPAKCAETVKPPALAGAAIAPGRAVQTGGAFKLIGAVSGQQNEISLSGGNYKMRLSRRVQ